MIDFKPSQVAMLSKSYLPFIGTFGSAEIEMAAGVIVAALAHHGDEWAPILSGQIGEWMACLPKESRWRDILSNPFTQIDVDQLIKGGWARWVGDESQGRKRPIELTQAALERIREKGFVVKAGLK